jgi:hypothetical protein
MAELFSVSDLARRFNCPPRVVSDLLYARIVPDGECPIVGGRRLIPEKYVSIIAKKLAERSRRREHRRDAATTA